MKDAKLVSSNLDIREKSKVCLALAFQLGLPSARLSSLSELVNILQNDLRNRRNRLYHDSWLLDGGALVRRAGTGSKLHRPQAHRLELWVPSFELIGPEPIQAFITDCLATTDSLITEVEFISEHYEREMQREGGGLFPRWKRLWHRLLRRSD